MVRTGATAIALKTGNSLLTTGKELDQHRRRIPRGSLSPAPLEVAAKQCLPTYLSPDSAEPRAQIARDLLCDSHGCQRRGVGWWRRHDRRVGHAQAGDASHGTGRVHGVAGEHLAPA